MSNSIKSKEGEIEFIFTYTEPEMKEVLLAAIHAGQNNIDENGKYVGESAEATVDYILMMAKEKYISQTVDHTQFLQDRGEEVVYVPDGERLNCKVIVTDDNNRFLRVEAYVRPMKLKELINKK